MSISQQEESLFTQWRQLCPDLVTDGVIDERLYMVSNPKILLIIKEVNDKGGGNWDLREFVRNGGRPQTWENVTRWLIGIRRLSEDIRWKELEKITELQRRDELKSIAVMNLKKSPGGHTTIPEQLHSAAARDRELLAEQFSIYSPDLIICCGTDASNALHAQVRQVQSPRWQQTRRGIWYHKMSNGAAVISYAHPEARVADSILYYGLVDAVREIRC